jgi:hypothetical protein
VAPATWRRTKARLGAPESEERHEVRAGCGKTVYTLDGHEAELDKLAGARATVKGSVLGEMVIVESLAAARKAVK